MARATPTLHEPKPAAEPPSDKSSGGRRIRFVLAAAAFIAVAVWFGPAIIGRTGLRHQFVHAVVPTYPGSASVGGSSLGWLSPVILHDVSLSDLDGVELLRFEELTTSRSLASLLFGSGDDLGTITLKQPRLKVRIRQEGTNLEDVLRPMLEGEGSQTGMTIVVEDGRVEWTTGDGDTTAGTLQNVVAKVRQSPSSSFPDRIEIAAGITDGEHTGKLSIRAVPADGKAGSGLREAVVAVEQLPLAPLKPWFVRFGIPIRATGLVSVDMLATERSGDRAGWSFDGSAEGRHLRLDVGDDESQPLLLESLTLKAAGAVADDSITLDSSELQSDVATATASGRLALDSFPAAESWDDRLRWAMDQSLAISASIDLARLTAQLPASSGVRQAVDSGRVQLEVRSSERGSDRIAVCRLRASDISAGPPGSRLVWSEPFSLELHLRQNAAGLTVDHFETKSDFLKLTGTGSAANAELTLDADLDRLGQKIGQFVTLPAGILSGRLTGSLRIKPLEPAGRFEISAGRLSLQSEGDELTVTLTEPVPFDRNGSWPLNVTAKGDVTRWLTRLRTVTRIGSTGDWDAAGTMQASAAVQYGANAISIRNLVADASQVKVRLGSRSIEEERVRLTGSGSWSTGTIAVTKATLACASAAIEATDLKVPLEGNEPIAGHLAFQAGIGRVAQYFLLDRPSIWLSGVARGTIDVRHSGATTTLNAQLDLERPQLSRPVVEPGGRSTWQPIWADEAAAVSLAGRFDAANDLLNVETFRMTGTGIAVQAAGSVGRPTTVADVDLTGTLSCDLDQLGGRLAGGLPDGLKVVGRSSKPFHLQGPLWSAEGIDPRLTAGAGIGWERAEMWGLAIGAGELVGTLRDRSIAIEPFDWPVGSGRVCGSAAISLGDKATLTVANGRLAEKIVLTPEICRQWLRYAAPILADATTIEGSASIDVGRCLIPLATPEASAADGTLVLHKANATPGPFAKSLLDVVRQIQTLAGKPPTNGSDLQLVAPPQNVAVRVAGGRIFHDRFLVHLGDENGPAVTTTGSVGFDQTLDLVAEVPLDRRWFKEERIAAALGGQTLRVPIRGTLSQPEPDPRALQDFGRKAAAGAIGGFLDRELNKQLEAPLKKLFE